MKLKCTCVLLDPHSDTIMLAILTWTLIWCTASIRQSKIYTHLHQVKRVVLLLFGISKPYCSASVYTLQAIWSSTHAQTQIERMMHRCRGLRTVFASSNRSSLQLNSPFARWRRVTTICVREMSSVVFAITIPSRADTRKVSARKQIHEHSALQHAQGCSHR